MTQIVIIITHYNQSVGDTLYRDGVGQVSRESVQSGFLTLPESYNLGFKNTTPTLPDLSLAQVMQQVLHTPSLYLCFFMDSLDLVLQS